MNSVHREHAEREERRGGTAVDCTLETQPERPNHNLPSYLHSPTLYPVGTMQCNYSNGSTLPAPPPPMVARPRTRSIYKFIPTLSRAVTTNVLHCTLRCARAYSLFLPLYLYLYMTHTHNNCECTLKIVGTHTHTRTLVHMHAHTHTFTYHLQPSALNDG